MKTNNHSSLALLLPLRSGMDLASYMQRFISDFKMCTGLFESQICNRGGGAAVIFSADVNDNGNPYIFEGCDNQLKNLILSPARNKVQEDNAYRRALLVIKQGGFISIGLSSFLYRQQGQEHFSVPSVIYQRNDRKDKRIPIDGDVLLRHRDGQSIAGKLRDITPSGISFYADKAFAAGEMFLASFEVLSCAITCETIITVAHCKPSLEGGVNRYIIGAQMQLVAAQRKKAEQLYLCRKKAFMKLVSRSSRFINQ